MRRRDFFRSVGASARPESRRLELPCDVLEVQYAQALLENRETEFLNSLRGDLRRAEHVTLKNFGLLRGETRELFERMFREYQAEGKRFERRD